MCISHSTQHHLGLLTDDEQLLFLDLVTAGYNKKDAMDEYFLQDMPGPFQPAMVDISNEVYSMSNPIDSKFYEGDFLGNPMLPLHL